MSDSTAPVTEEKIVFASKVQTVDVELPSMPKSRVTLRKNLTSEEAEKIALSFPEGDMTVQQANIISMRLTIAAMFVSWNLTDEQGGDLPCTPDVLKRFFFSDLAAMMQGITGKQLVDAPGNFLNADDSKKKISNA